MARTRDNDRSLSIMEAAVQVFGERGFASTTIKDIARQAGIAPGTIYLYFRDKEELFRATVTHGWERLLGEVRALQRAPEDFFISIRRLVEVAMELLRQAFPLLRGMLFEASRMNLVESHLDDLCAAIDQFIVTAATRQSLEINPDRPSRLTTIKVIVLGTLMAASLAKKEDLEQEIRRLQANILQLTWERLERATAGAAGAGQTTGDPP